RSVERVTGFGDFVMVGETMGQLALEHISPVRAVAAVAWQPRCQRGAVDVLAERHEIDRVAADLPVPVLHWAVIFDLRGALLRYLRHLPSPLLGPRAEAFGSPAFAPASSGVTADARSEGLRMHRRAHPSSGRLRASTHGHPSVPARACLPGHHRCRVNQYLTAPPCPMIRGTA